MGKLGKISNKSSLKKPVTKSIAKHDGAKQAPSVAKKLKNKVENTKGTKPKKQKKIQQHEEVQEEVEDLVPEQVEEEEINEEVEEEEQVVETAENFEEEKAEDGNIELENNAEDDEDVQKPVQRTNNLIKVMKPTTESGSIYTGGKILVNSENDMFALCENEIVIYSLDTHTVKKKISQENEEIANFALHPNNKTLAYFTKNFLVRYVNIEDNTVHKTWKVQNQYVLDMAIDATGRLLALGAANGVIQVFDLKNFTTTHQFTNNKGAISKLEFHPRPQKLYLISLCEDFSLRVYDLVVNSCVATFQNFEQTPSSFTLLEDGINVLTSSYDQKINLYDLQQLKHQTAFDSTEEIAAIENIRVTIPKTKEVQTFLVLGGQSGVLKTLNLSLEEPIIQEHDYIHAEQIVKILKLKKGKKIALVTAEQNIIILSYFINPQGQLQFAVQNQLPGYNDEVIDIKFMKRKQDAVPSNLDYFAYCTNSSQIRVYYPEKKQTDFIWGHEDIVLCLDTFANYIVSGSKDNTIKLWHHMDGNFRLMATFKGHNESVGTVSFSPVKGNYIVSGSADKNVKLWQISNIKKKIMATQAEEVTTAKNTVLAHDKDINCVKFSPNEKLIATASQDRSIKLFQRDGLKLIKQFKGHKRGVWDIAFSPVEKVIASASGDNTVKVWNLVDGTCMKTLEGHISPVLKVEWMCYGLEVISASADGLIKIWNVKKMACVNTLEKHEGKLWSLAVRQNPETGKHEVLSGDNNSTWIHWEDNTVEEDEAKKEESNKKILQQQQMWMLLRDHKYFEAGKLAFDLNMIRHFKTVVETLLNKAEFRTEMIYTVEDEEEGDNEENTKGLEENDFRNLVKYCMETDMKRFFPIVRDLNSVAKYARIAQRMVEIILEGVDFDDLDAFKKQYNTEGGDNKTNLKDYLEILLSYSERHFSRVQKYVTKSFYLDYVMKHSFLISQNDKNKL